MEQGILAYILVWATACLAAVGLALHRRHQVVLLQAAYWRFLAAPWRLATGALGTATLVLFAPLSGDPTWDTVDSLLMAGLTYATAPWSVGVLYRVVRRRLAPWQAYVAACAWLFSASWSYDLYLLLRDGAHPVTWSTNLVASSILYLCAGLLWNLCWRPERGVRFAFMNEVWPDPQRPRGESLRVLPFVLPLALVFGLLLVVSLLERC